MKTPIWIAACLALAPVAEASTATTLMKSHVRISSSCLTRTSGPDLSQWAHAIKDALTPIADLTVICSRGVSLMVLFTNRQGIVTEIVLPAGKSGQPISLSKFIASDHKKKIVGRRDNRPLITMYY